MVNDNDTKPKIILLDPGIASCTYEEELFTNHGYRFEVFDGEKGDYNGKRELASDAEGLLIRFTEIDDRFLSHTPKVKAIARYGVGYDNIDLEACTRHGVLCSNVRGYGNHSVSDHALSLILGSMRQLGMGQKQIHQTFGAPPLRSIPELQEMVLGIIGLGRIGGTLAQKAQGLFGKVIACDPYIDSGRFEELGVASVSLDQLLQQSDAISIHCNLTSETHHMIDQEAFNKMDKQPILVNTARGPIVKESAVVEALEQGLLHSAGLDVFETELPEKLNRNLVDHPRVIATGHYAWYSDRAQRELQQRTADNLLSMLKGNIPEDCLNPP